MFYCIVNAQLQFTVLNREILNNCFKYTKEFEKNNFQ